MGACGNFVLADREQFPISNKTLIETFRTLAQSQGSLSASDISDILLHYVGPPESAEFMLSPDFLPFGVSEPTNDVITYPPLAMALRLYVVAYLAEYKYEVLHDAEVWHDAEKEQWASLIIRLLRTGATLHAPMPHFVEMRNESDVSYEVTKYGTPLDEMFTFTDTPAEARAVANGWLQILRSEGYDVVAYIEKESDLHYTRSQTTFPLLQRHEEHDSPRELIFELEQEKQSIYWDWWTDPSSSIYLLRSTLKPMLMLSRSFITYHMSSEVTWPFHYPKWYGYCHPTREDEEAVQQQLYDMAQRRANRRLQKRHAKESRSRGLKYPSMPGAWQN